MVKQRVLTALALLLPLGLLFAFAPNGLVAVVVGLVVALGAWEWARMSHFRADTSQGLLVLLLVVTTGWVLGSGVIGGWSVSHYTLLGLAVLWWALVLVGLLAYRPGWSKHTLGRWSLRLSSFLTLVPAGLAIVWLHCLNPLLVFYLVALVAVADTAAFFVGRRFGRTKLAPGISPGKSREGLLGALIAVSVFSAAAAWAWALAPLDAVAWLLLSLVVAMVSVVGDLHESILKREAGVKDSGTLLPGHGGMLDRMDSMTAAAPIFLAGLLWTALPVTGGC